MGWAVADDDLRDENVLITLSDMCDENITVQVTVLNSRANRGSVLEALRAEYCVDSAELVKVCGRVRLVARLPGQEAQFIACDLSKRIGRCRSFLARGLSELLSAC